MGKACNVDSAHTYSLSEEECQRYKIEHSHGLVKQSTATDVFSLGRIIKKMNRRVIKDAKINNIVQECLQYHSHSRPSVKKIIECLRLYAVYARRCLHMFFYLIGFMYIPFC